MININELSRKHIGSRLLVVVKLQYNDFDNEYEESDLSFSIKKIKLIEYIDYKIKEISEDCKFIRLSRSFGRDLEKDDRYGVWYEINNFSEIFEIIKILPVLTYHDVITE